MVDMNPYIITDDSASGSVLAPLPAKDKAFQEDWLQELLFRHPSILPMGYLDESYGPLVPLGREIASIDDLYVSPSGLITIVETKLWRNAEAHRTVVAQILDYAKILATWNYRELDEAVKSYMNKRIGQPMTIFGAVKKADRNFHMNEIEFESRVRDCLANGKFALLVVGDRIFPEVTQLAETLQAAPHLHYTLNFVELRCYRLEKGSNWPMIVVPHFMAKTKEVMRAIVTVTYEEKKPDIQVEAMKEQEESPQRTNMSIFTASLPSNIRESFGIYLERWMKAGYTIFWGKAGFSLRIPWLGKLTTMFYGFPGTLSIISAKWAQQINLPSEEYGRYKDEIMRSQNLGSLYVAGRRDCPYDSLEEDEVILTLNSTDRLVVELLQRTESEKH